MTQTALRHRGAAAAVLALALAAAPGTGAAADTRPDEPSQPVGALLAQVRAATAQYLDVAAAVAAGYAPASPCVPSMGYHYQKQVPHPGTGDGTVPLVTVEATDLDPSSPEILVYAPRTDGRLALVAVEYATWDADAELFGRPFDAPHDGGPPFHTLHAWVWQANPAGVFEPLNPNVRCD